MNSVHPGCNAKTPSGILNDPHQIPERLAMAMAGELWELEFPSNWRKWIMAQFGHLPHSPGNAVVRIAIHDQPNPVEKRGIEIALRAAPCSDSVLTSRSQDGIRHASRFAIDRYNPDFRTAESVLLAPTARDTFLGSNLLLRQIVWRAAERGMVPLHAAAIGTPAGFWLLPAGAGSGKSTAAAAAAAMGFQVLGDDFVLWDPATGVLHSLYGVIRLGTMSLAMLSSAFPGTAFEECGLRDDFKRVVMLPRHSTTAAQGRMLGMLILSSPGQSPAQRPGPSAVLKHFASTLLLLPSLGFSAATALHALGPAVREFPAFPLDLRGGDFSEIERFFSQHT